MPEADLIRMFVQPLNGLSIRYMVSGSVAAMLYGEPRVTHDIDLVIFLRPKDIAQIPQAFPGPDFYTPPVDILGIELRREQRGHFNVIHKASALKADFYLAGSDELHAWAIGLVKSYKVSDTFVQLAPPEYVILRKLEFYREGGSMKHLRDIRSMLEVSGQQIDCSALEVWVRRRGLMEEWAKAKTDV